MFGQPLERLRSTGEGRPSGVAIAAGLVVELQRAPLTTPQVRTLYATGHHVRALVACGTDDRVVHVSSHCVGFLVLETMPRECDKMNSCRGTLSKSCLGDVPILILADLNVIPHLSLTVRSAIDLGGWTDCAAVVAEASAKEPLRHVLCTRDLRIESMHCLQN